MNRGILRFLLLSFWLNLFLCLTHHHLGRQFLFNLTQQVHILQHLHLLRIICICSIYCWLMRTNLAVLRVFYIMFLNSCVELAEVQFEFSVFKNRFFLHVFWRLRPERVKELDWTVSRAVRSWWDVAFVSFAVLDCSCDWWSALA